MGECSIKEEAHAAPFAPRRLDCSPGGLVWLFLECGPELVLLGVARQRGYRRRCLSVNLKAKYLTCCSETAQSFSLASSRRSSGASFVQGCRAILLVRSPRSDRFVKPHRQSFPAGYNVSPVSSSSRSWIWGWPTMCEMSVLDFCSLVDPLRCIASWGHEEIEIQEESPQDLTPDPLAFPKPASFPRTWPFPESISSRQLSRNCFRYSKDRCRRQWCARRHAGNPFFSACASSIPHSFVPRPQKVQANSAITVFFTWLPLQKASKLHTFFIILRSVQLSFRAPLGEMLEVCPKGSDSDRTPTISLLYSEGPHRGVMLCSSLDRSIRRVCSVFFFVCIPMSLLKIGFHLLPVLILQQVFRRRCTNWDVEIWANLKACLESVDFCTMIIEHCDS